MSNNSISRSNVIAFKNASQIDRVIGKSARYVKQLANAIPHIVWTASPDGLIDYYSQAWFDHTGLTFEQTQGYGWKSAIHPDDLQNCILLYDHAFQTGSPYQAIYRLKNISDNSYRWHLGRALPVKDQDGKVIKWMGTCTDIDIQKKETETSEARFRVAMDITADAICLLDRVSMRFIDCNDTACRMFGYSRAELLELGPSDVSDSIQSQLEIIYDEIIGGKTYPVTEGIFRRKDGSRFPVETQRQAMHSGDKWIIVLVARDITNQKEAEFRLQQLAYYDQLTGLPNRNMFYESLKNALVQAEKQCLTISVLLINLDRLKEVNNLFGLASGDELLRQVGHRLINNLRIRDIVGRLGGDEFGLILFNSEHSQGATIVANKVLQILDRPFDLDGHAHSITVSIGMTVYPVDATDADSMVRYANSAMNEAKQAGGNVFRFHTAEMNAKMLEKRTLHEALNHALINDEFVLHYQPKVQIGSGQWKSVEALLRWNRPGHGLVSPALFIPAMEETGAIVPAGAWIITTACRQIREWGKSAIGPIRVAINVSAKQFLQEELGASIAAAIEENDIDPDLLEIELTESSLMVDAKKTIAVLNKLKALGVHISIDDFGTGYSSLAYLKQFPIDNLKIDIAFIRDVTTNASDAAITTAIINMAHSLNMKVIAEGVETKEQLDFLRVRNCDEFQGYYFSKPLPAVDLGKMRQSIAIGHNTRNMSA